MQSLALFCVRTENDGLCLVLFSMNYDYFVSAMRLEDIYMCACVKQGRPSDSGCDKRLKRAVLS